MHDRSGLLIARLASLCAQLEQSFFAITAEPNQRNIFTAPHGPKKLENLVSLVAHFDFSYVSQLSYKQKLHYMRALAIKLAQNLSRFF